MLKILSKEESEKYEKEMDEWLLSLHWNIKAGIKNLIEPLLEQVNCSHEWVDNNSYENELPKNEFHCRKCYLTKKKE